MLDLRIGLIARVCRAGRADAVQGRIEMSRGAFNACKVSGLQAAGQAMEAGRKKARAWGWRPARVEKSDCQAAQDKPPWGSNPTSGA